MVEGTDLIVTNPASALAKAESKLTKVLASVPDHPRAHMYLGLVEICTKRQTEGIAKCEHALALDRNLAHAHNLIGLGKTFIGRAEETEAHVAEALRLSPRDTMAYLWLNVAGVAKLHLGSYEQAVAWLRRSVEANRNYPLAIFHLAAALAQLDRLEEAQAAVKAGLAVIRLHHLPRPRLPDGEDRRPDLSRPARAHFEGLRRPESPTMTADRRRKLAHPRFLMGRMMRLIPFLYSLVYWQCPRCRPSAQSPLKLGLLLDMSGPYADVGGQGSVTAARMAVDDFGGKVLGRPRLRSSLPISGGKAKRLILRARWPGNG